MTSMLPPRDWTDIHWPDISGAGPARWIAVLPLAATEQHGPHLPVGTDVMIAQAYLARVRELLADTIPATFLPLQPVGISTEHIDYPGTLTLPTEIALKTWMALGESVARAGLKKLVMVTSHGGNSAAMSLVAQDLRAKYGLLVGHHRMVALRCAGGIVSGGRIASRHSWRRGRDLDHAGAIPAAGAQRRDRRFSSRRASRWKRIIAGFPRTGRRRSHGRPRIFTPSGAAGDATQASAEKGEQPARSRRARVLRIARRCR